MAEHVRWAIGVLVAALALGGCTAGTTGESSTSLVPSARTSVMPSVVDPSTSPPPLPRPTPSVVDPSPLTTGTGGVTVAPLPAGLTPDQAADAEAAIEVYRRYWALSDEALSDPDRGWSTEVSEVANGTAADMLERDIAAMARDGLHTSGQTILEVTVTKVEPAIVFLTGCVDVSATDVRDSNGQSVKVPDGPGTYARFTTSTQVGQVQGGAWLVTVDTFDRSTTC